MAKRLPKRSDVPEDVTWNLHSVFPSDEAWEAARAEAEAALPRLAELRGRLGESGATLLRALRTRDQALNHVARVGLYANMQLAGDTSDQSYVARSGQASSLSARAAEAGAFFEPELLEIGADRLETLLAEAPELRVYEHYFDQLERLRPHVRSTEVMSLLAAASDLGWSPAGIHEALENADLKFAAIKDEQGTDVEVQQGNVWPLIHSRKRQVRQAAWEAYADGYLQVKNTMAAALLGGVKRDVFYARAYGYASSLEMDLHRDNIPSEVFYTLLDTFQRHLPVWHRYWEIRRRALGVDQLHVYDIFVPLVRQERPIPYEEAISIVCTGMAPLGEEYGSALRRGLTEERWVDIYPNQGKGSGAFSSGEYGTHPFLMLNYDETLGAVSTLAHELGHSMHSYLTWQSQPPIYSGYAMFAAETASNFNQALVRAALLERENEPDFQLEVLAEALNNFHRYLFIMPTLARFTLDCHERVERGEGLTADGMSARLVELFREAYGSAVAIDEPRVGMTWAQFPHLFANFYVFTYATGIAAANALAQGVLQEGQPAAERYLRFLKAGGSMYPLDALRMAGVDMRSPEPIERAFRVLEGFIDRLDQLVGTGPL